MSKISQQALNNNVTYENNLTHYANSLICFAETDLEFTSFLKKQVCQYLSQNSEQASTISTAKYPAWKKPRDRKEAEVWASWLIRELYLHQPNHVAGHILRSWSKSIELPKNLFIGVVGLAIIGPTLGLVKKNHHDDPIHLLFDQETYLKVNELERANLHQQAVMNLISHSLDKVAGDCNRLEPSLQYWMFCNQTISIAKTGADKLNEIHRKLTNESMPHITQKKENSIFSIAISPAVTRDSLQFLEVDFEYSR